MLVQQEQQGGKGVFFIAAEDNRLAAMTYTLPAPDKMIIEHTEVGEELRGQNAGYLLVQAAVDYARAHHMTIIPLCPFAHAVFKKKPEYADVWRKNYDE